MNDPVPAPRAAIDDPVRIGVLSLTDSAPAIVAFEFGFFADEGLNVQLTVEPSWANIADKLAHRALEAAIVLPPLVFAIALGLRGPVEPLIVPYAISLGGDTVTLAKGSVAANPTPPEAAQALARVLRARGPETALAVVHDHSTHNLLLRYWLASAGVVAGRDYRLIVVPPVRMVEALASGRILGFCAGAPWGEVAERAGVGETVAASGDIWREAPEKCLAVREIFARQSPERLAAVLRALHRAALFCDAPENATYVASLLSRRKYLGVDSHAILSSLPKSHGDAKTSRFFAHAATYPWRSHALWFLTQMRRWELLPPGQDLRAAAARVYRPDLYVSALTPVGAATPLRDEKVEGAHPTDWMLDTSRGPLPRGADGFCDGAIFDPASVG